LAHIGDSRAYLMGPTGATLLSEDHSLTQSLINSGVITAQEALTRADRHTILRCLGELRNLPPSHVHILPQGSLELTEEDVICLCSDGVWEQLSPEVLAGLVRNTPDRQQCAQAILGEVLRSGAPDNATVVLISCQQVRNIS
jgi:protein phosphatase